MTRNLGVSVQLRSPALKEAFTTSQGVQVRVTSTRYSAKHNLTRLTILAVLTL